MHRVVAALAGLAVAVAVPGAASADPSERGEQTSTPGQVHSEAHARGHDHDKTTALSRKQRALRTKAQEKVLKGQAQSTDQGGDNVVKVAKGQYVELAREGEDSIWTVTAEFGDAPATHEGLTHEGPAGPMHNEIPKPDRSVDNTTIWAPDFSRDYYMDLLFSEEPGAVSMRNFYLENSSNRYTVNGDVTDWAQVPYNAASYGSNDCDHDGDGTGDNEEGDADDIVCQDTWRFVDDSVDAWYQRQLAAGKTTEAIDEYLSRFDVWDRYDYDGDGNFDEADGYIDHFQSVHAGVGEETGGGEQGDDAIWSHRWYVQLTGIGDGGPTLDNGDQVMNGGTQIGQSKYWIGDYTVEPENGGVGVFAHEFGHDLGLPDLYDTSGNTGGA
ncbi:MAG: immune inhibitor A, partial [Actinomycetota bacterium]|nr:immune inhibitor A [Actinomycetota bacterium]